MEDRAQKTSESRQGIILFLALAMLFYSSGCATILRGNRQTITVVTHPPGSTISYQGLEISDGEYVTITKRFEVPRLNVGTQSRQQLVEMQYDPDPLIFVDAGLLVLFVVPGLVALGVDFATGAWRDLHNPQTIHVPEPPDDSPDDSN